MRDKLIDKTCDKAIFELSKGDKDALSVIYDCMARMMFSLAYAITVNYHDAEDVLQDTLIEVVKYAHTYKSGSNATAWILTMVRHRSIDIIRKRKLAVSVEKIKTVCMPESKSDISQLEVLDMLSVLDEDEMQILVLRLYTKMPYKEIMDIMRISIAAAQKKYQRAVRKLKDYYGGVNNE